MEETMEDLAINGKSIEKKAMKAERARLKQLEKVKRALKVDDAWNEEPIEAMEIGESLVSILTGLKDPLVKKVLGKKHKQAVNSLIDAVAAVKSVAGNEVADIMAKV